MTISATERDELRDLARAALGDRGAELLMAGLPTVDLGAMEERLSQQSTLLRAELKADMSELRGEFAELRGELKGDIGTLRAEFGKLEGQFGELRGEFGELRGDVDQHLAGLRGEIAGQNRLFYFAIVTTVVGIIALVISAFFAAWAV